MNVHRPRRFAAGAASLAPSFRTAVYRALLAVGLLLIAVASVAAQSPGSFGRTTVNGAWTDAFWVNAGGVIGPLPPSGADVFIGSAAFPSSFAQPDAMVTLTGARTAATVTLGRQPDDLGTLTIQPGGALTTGSLSIGAAGGDGILTVAPGGSLTVTGALTAGSVDGMATINLNGQTIAVGAYSQGGPVTINRASSGGIQSPSFSIFGGGFEIQAADNFGLGSVSGGATVSNTVSTSLVNFTVSGAGTSYAAAAPLTLGGGNSLQIYSGATFTANAQVTSGGSFFVSGSGAVLNVNAPLTAPGVNSQVVQGGVMNSSANVTIGGLSVFNAGSTLNLNAGTFAADFLSVSSGGVVNRTGGAYDVDGLTLDGGISLAYQAADDIAASLSLSTGVNFTLQKNLALTGSLNVNASTLNLAGRTATVSSFNRTGAAVINRGAGGNIQGQSFSIDGGSPYVLDGTDSFTASGSVSGGATVSNTVALNLSSSLGVSGAGTSYAAGAPLSLSSLSVVSGATFTANAQVTSGGSFFVSGSGAVLNVNAPLTAPGVNSQVVQGGVMNSSANVTIGGLSVFNAGSTLNLNAGTFAADFLSVSSGGVVNRTGGAYDVDGLTLDGGISLAYQAADDIAASLSLSTGVNFTLQKNLALTGSLNVNASTLNLAGRTATVSSFNRTGAAVINRGAGGNIQGQSFSIDGGSPYVLDGTDSFTASGSVSGGATVSNTVALNLSSSLGVSGAGTSYAAGAPLSLSSLSVVSGATFNANAQVTSGGNFFVSGSGAVLNVNAPLTAPGVNSQVVQGGVMNSSANVTIGGLSVFNAGATLNLNAGTFSAGVLSVSSGGVLNAQNDVTLASPLSISSGGNVNVIQSLGDLTGLSLEGNALTIDATSSLNLAFDARRRPGALDWAFRWQGDRIAQVLSLLGGRILITGNPQPASVIYNPVQFGDFTYIGFIPRVGDFDGDDDLDVADYLLLSGNLLKNVTGMTPEQSYLMGDVTGDLRIDGKDFAEFRTAYDEANGVGAFVAMLATVPEPSTIVSAMVALALCLCARRR